MKKRMLSAALVLCMLLTLLPVSALAAFAADSAEAIPTADVDEYKLDVSDGQFSGQIGEDADGYAIRANNNSGAWNPGASDKTYLQLVPLQSREGDAQTGSAFITEKVPLDGGMNFSTHFTFSLTGNITSAGAIQERGHAGDPCGPAIGDGFCFVIQPNSNTVGSQGEGLGYKGIDNSIAVEFDVFNNTYQWRGPSTDKSCGDQQTGHSVNKTADGKIINEYDKWGPSQDNHIAVDFGGKVIQANQLGFQYISVPFYCGDEFNQDAPVVCHAWIEYDGTSKTMEIRISDNRDRPINSNLTINDLSLTDYITTEDSSAYVGFTASTDRIGTRMVIHEWQFLNRFVEDGVSGDEPDKPVETTPTATFTATGPDSGTLSDLTDDENYKYSLDGGNNWTDFTGSTATIAGGITTTNGVKVVKKGNTTTTSDSTAQTIAVTQAKKPTDVGKTDETVAKNDGTITGLTAGRTTRFPTITEPPGPTPPSPTRRSQALPPEPMRSGSRPRAQCWPARAKASSSPHL